MRLFMEPAERRHCLLLSKQVTVAIFVKDRERVENSSKNAIKIA